jgi:hypothetical protein
VCVNAQQQAIGSRKPNHNWDDLRYFLAVARTGTLSAAAEQLGTEGFVSLITRGELVLRVLSSYPEASDA